MLYQIGPLSIRVAPFNVNNVSRVSSTDYASKPVMGVEPPLEYVGEGSTEFRFTGDLFPRVIGGEFELAILHAMRESGPQFAIRGDGYILGWLAIRKVSESSEHLDRSGVGQKIGVTIEATRAQPPKRHRAFLATSRFFT